MNSKLDIKSYEITGNLTYTRLIGRGTAANVYEGQYQNKRVAIKKAHPVYEDDLLNERDILIFLMDANPSNDYVVKPHGFEFTYAGYLLGFWGANYRFLRSSYNSMNIFIFFNC